MARFIYVYVLVSETDSSIHYTGVTRDLSGRLQEHNRGNCSHTAKHKPWKIETAIGFKSETKAREFDEIFEKWIGPRIRSSSLLKWCSVGAHSQSDGLDNPVVFLSNGDYRECRQFGTGCSKQHIAVHPCTWRMSAGCPLQIRPGGSAVSFTSGAGRQRLDSTSNMCHDKND
jgi:putative endonuclease